MIMNCRNSIPQRLAGRSTFIRLVAIPFLCAVAAAFPASGQNPPATLATSGADPSDITQSLDGLRQEDARLTRDLLDLSKALSRIEQDLRVSGIYEGMNDDVARASVLPEEVAALREAVSDLERRVEAAGAAPLPAAESVGERLAALQDALARLSPQHEAAASSGIAALVGTDAALSVSATHVWVLLAAFLVMFMQIGFALLETGLTRARNAAHTLLMNLLDYGIGALAFWGFGFALMFGGVGAIDSLGLGPVLDRAVGFTIDGTEYTVFGLNGFLPSWESLTAGAAAFFLFQMAFAATANTICTGALAERWRLPAFALASVFVTGLIYPLFGHWVWGGGWLAAIGYVDFAGSTVVHAVGGVVAFVGAIAVGPRKGKYGPHGVSNPIPGHNMAYVVLGTFILAFGWFGFNAGSTLNAADLNIAIVAANTALASAAGMVAAALTTAVRFGRPDPSFCCNGMLAGLVGITAPCAFVDAWAAVLIGAISGVLVVFSALFIDERLRVDDPVGAVSVHGVCGLWGGLAVGIFANGKNGVAGLVAGDNAQIGIQAIGVASAAVTAAFLAWIVFKLIDAVTPLRASDGDQDLGLDLAELGVEAYPESKIEAQPPPPGPAAAV